MIPLGNLEFYEFGIPSTVTDVGNANSAFTVELFQIITCELVRKTVF